MTESSVDQLLREACADPNIAHHTLQDILDMGAENLYAVVEDACRLNRMSVVKFYNALYPYTANQHLMEIALLNHNFDIADCFPILGIGEYLYIRICRNSQSTPAILMYLERRCPTIRITYDTLQEVIYTNGTSLLPHILTKFTNPIPIYKTDTIVYPIATAFIIQNHAFTIHNNLAIMNHRILKNLTTYKIDLIDEVLQYGKYVVKTNPLFFVV